MRQSQWLVTALFCAAFLPQSAPAASLNEAEFARPRGPLLSPGEAWSLQETRSPDVEGVAAQGLLHAMVASAPPEVAEHLLGRLDDPILLRGGLEAARAASAQLRNEAQSASEVQPQRPRAEALTEEQTAAFAVIGLSVLILAGSGVAFVARAPGGVGGLSRS